MMVDCLIVGGGVIGLSLAYELAGQGWRVRVIDRGQPGQQASWAGAGILPPASLVSNDPLEQLKRFSNELHSQWAEDLRAQTGIDTGLRTCGAVYLARDAAGADELRQLAESWRSERIAAEELSPAALADLEPGLQAGQAIAAWLVPEERQIRNPWHLRALVEACGKRGVEVSAGVAAEDFVVSGRRVEAVRTSAGVIAAGSVCIAGGSWSGALVERLGMPPAIRPIRGQIVLLKTRHPLFSRIINEQRRYLVPRSDGRMLVGSTEEDVGFDCGNTPAAVEDLLKFAQFWAPSLRDAQFERSWAGLRPQTRDGLPYLGRATQFDNAFVATGHYRNGLQLSTGTAAVMSQLMRGIDPQIDLSAFRVDRG